MSTTGNNYVGYGRGPMPPCIYGLAAGDALGVPYEFCGRGAFECTGMADGGTHGQPAGTWPDDTDTTAAVAGALAGVYYGFEAIPPKWAGRLRGKAVIGQCI